MKKVALILIIILLTGCQKNNIITCSLEANNDDSNEQAIMVGLFEKNKLIEIKNIGSITYLSDDNANYIYNYFNETFDNMNYNGLEKDLYNKNKTVYYELIYNFNTMSKNDIESSLGSFGTSYSFFKKYAISKGYNCN